MTMPWRSLPPSSNRPFRRFLKFATTSAFAVGIAAGVAHADGHYKNWSSIEDGFEKASRELLRGLNDNSCYSGNSGNIKLAFVGIPQNNVHFSDQLRGKLNRIARRSISQVAYNINVLTPSAFGTIASLNPGDPVQLRKAIEQIKSAPLTFVITATRPAKNIAQLKFEVFARSGEGVQVCPKSDEVFVDLIHNKSIPPEEIPTSGQKKPVVVHAWAFKHAVREAAAAIREFKSVVVDIDYQMSGSCSIQQNSSNIFQSDYFEVGQEFAAALSVGANEWPLLETPGADTPKNAAILKLQFAPDQKFRDLLQLTLKVVSGRHTRLVKYMRVLIDPDDLAGCRNLSRDFLTRIIEQSKSASRQFSIAASQKKFIAKKDKVSVSIDLKADRHLYCWIIAPDRAAFVLFPWTEAQASKVWKANETVQYPQSFKNLGSTDNSIVLRDVIYPHAAKELFSCFATAKRLPDELEKKWIEMHAFNKGGGGEHRSIDEKGVKQTLAAMRRVEGVEEHYTWIVAVE